MAGGGPWPFASRFLCIAGHSGRRPRRGRLKQALRLVRAWWLWKWLVPARYRPSYCFASALCRDWLLPPLRIPHVGNLARSGATHALGAYVMVARGYGNSAACAFGLATPDRRTRDMAHWVLCDSQVTCGPQWWFGWCGPTDVRSVVVVFWRPALHRDLHVTSTPAVAAAWPTRRQSRRTPSCQPGHAKYLGAAAHVSIGPAYWRLPT